MSNRVNIPRSVKDKHYRYTMAPLETKIEGSGNGIYCKIPNLKEVSGDLKREPIDILKFFGNKIFSFKKKEKKQEKKFSCIHLQTRKEIKQKIILCFFLLNLPYFDLR